MSKKQYELGANDELLQPSDLALSGGVPVNENVSTLFSGDNTSLTSTIKDCGGVQHDANGYFIETEI